MTTVNSDQTKTSAASTIEAAKVPLPLDIRLKLSVMMFLQYFTWGCWSVTLGTYLGAIDFTDPQIGSVSAVTAIAAMIAPFFVGMVADRFFATQHILTVLHLVGAGLLFFASRIDSYPLFYTVLLSYLLCYMPTLSLTNSLSMHNMSDPSQQFPGIRVLGTLGWIAAGLFVGLLTMQSLVPGERIGIEATNIPLQIGAASSLLTGVFCLLLPHTPPSHKGTAVSWKTVMGLEALQLMKRRSFAIFMIGSLLICIPLYFYYVWTNPFLNEIGVKNAAAKMTFGQMSEVFFMLILPLLVKRFGLKSMLLIGMTAWVIRYVLFAFGNATTDGMWMLYGGIILHGICYDFYFVTGYIYVDQQASVSRGAAAQGMFTFVTMGVGGFIGMQISGFVVGYFATGNNQHEWREIWLIPAVTAALIGIVFALLFHDRENSADVDRVLETDGLQQPTSA